MTKEITPEDIRKKYMEEKVGELKENLLYCIDTMNNLLQKRYERIIENGKINIPFNETFEIGKTGKERENIVNHLRDFFTSWNIEEKIICGVYYIEFSPKELIDSTIKLDLSTIKEQKEEVSPDDMVKDRSEILDL